MRLAAKTNVLTSQVRKAQNQRTELEAQVKAQRQQVHTIYTLSSKIYNNLTVVSTGKRACSQSAAQSHRAYRATAPTGGGDKYSKATHRRSGCDAS